MVEYFSRKIETSVSNVLKRGKSVFLIGARQTGKTTLVNRLPSDLLLSLVHPKTRLRYEKDPTLFTGEIENLADSIDHKPLIIIDEIQKIPSLTDSIQDLIDRGIAQFILTGSSARKLRKQNINWLPGRVVLFYLEPLILQEFDSDRVELETLLLYGALPGIMTTPKSQDKEKDLDAYVTAYLEEEIRAEALVRHLGSFARFLELAASESGRTVNFSKFSQQIGVAHNTIEGYYQILEDCLVAKRIEPLTKTPTKRRLLKTHKYLLFDLGIRRICAREGVKYPKAYWGSLFEQWVGLELIRCAQLKDSRIQILYWRSLDGPEIDWVIDTHDEYIPIEVKWTEKPRLNEAKHLELFIQEYKEAKRGYIICKTPRSIKISPRVIAIPWQALDELFFNLT